MDSQAAQPAEKSAFSRLRDQILTGEMAPGTKISEPELALALGIGRSPVREAILKLEQEGFVVRSASGRVSVAPLEVAELQQLYVVRANLEGLATRLATGRLRNIDLEEMAAILVDMRAGIEGGRFREAVMEGRAFHTVIHRECDNKPLIDALVRLESKIDRYRYFAASFDRYSIRRVEEHEEILKALYRRDADAAEAAMIAHINQSLDALMENISKRPAVTTKA
jgi:DNA-binding GntR family transcriptional regulator